VPAGHALGRLVEVDAPFLAKAVWGIDDPI